jgi:hypothetical protein
VKTHLQLKINNNNNNNLPDDVFLVSGFGKEDG